MRKNDVKFYADDTNGIFYDVYEDSIRVIKMFVTGPVVVIPESIDGLYVRFIDRYCFADKIINTEITNPDVNKFAAATGAYIKEIICPNTITSIEDYAFYGCSNMMTVTIGSDVKNIGSDIFMNCTKLCGIIVNCKPDEQTIIRKILLQLKSNISVKFERDEILAIIFYPEYSESYDEVGPAHIFALNVEGDGFKTRQCFNDGVVDFKQYDALFVSACLSESCDNLCNMALGRIMYPYDLSEKSKAIYRDYISKNEKYVVDKIVDEKNIEKLVFMAESDLITIYTYDKCIDAAAVKQWHQGMTMLIRYRQEKAEKELKNRYSFDDF